MCMRILLAGATGVVGRRLIPLLLDAQHEIFGTTRSEAKAADLSTAGVNPVVVDVLDAGRLARVVDEVRPEIVIHQLTDLPPDLDPKRMPEAISRNARIRREGTQNLVTAALEVGTRRLIAQSIAWAYAPGGEPHSEDDPLDLQTTDGGRAITVGGVAALERLTLGSKSLEGVVLRYGHLYGPGTHRPQAAGGTIPVHIDAAAQAALLAITNGQPGAYNIAEPNAYLSTEKARRELGWDAGFRLNDRLSIRAGTTGAPEPGPTPPSHSSGG
jgi:nucleoside-diphosphate-sugar epimerase